MDIAGPKLRTAEVLCGERSHLKVGDSLLLGRRLDVAVADQPFQSTCTAPHVLDRLKAGDRVSIDDGVLRGTVAGPSASGFLIRIEEGRDKGLKLKPGRSLLFPGVDLGLEPLSPRDRADLDFVAAHTDIVGYSFVETAADIALLQDELQRRRPDWTRLGILAKIETPRAVANLPAIIVQAGGRQPLGVMIARGDLAIELGFERLAEMQEEILWICEAASVPAVWATQVLDGLVRKGMPSRGEMTDAAMAARAECVMLNKGPNVGRAVDALDRLLRRMGEHQFKKTPTLRALKAWTGQAGPAAGSWALAGEAPTAPAPPRR
jgi:pyruvate kinase